MTATILQNELIGRITSIGDINILQSIKGNLNQSNSDLMKVSLTTEQIEMLMMSEFDIANGDLITEEELEKMDSKWML